LLCHSGEFFFAIPSIANDLIWIFFEIASAAGATVIATSSSDAKLETARHLGATHTINYRKTPDWSSEALEITNGVGVDIVVDVVGGADLLHSVTSLRYGGRIALLGVLNKEDEPVSLTQPLLYGGKSSESSSFRFWG